VRFEVLVAGHEPLRRAILEERRPEVSGALERLREESAGEDVVGRAAQHRLELHAGTREVAGVEERAPERHPRRRVVRLGGEAIAGDTDRLLVLAFLAELLRKLGEEP
jgi:hypothetical protein